MEMIATRKKPHNDQIAENPGHISISEDANEKTPLISDVTTKVVEDAGEIY